MNFNGDVPGFDGNGYKKFDPKKPGLLTRVLAWLTDDPPAIVVTPYQFRLELSEVPGAGGTLVLHVRERRGSVHIRFDRDQLFVLERVLGEVKR